MPRNEIKVSDFGIAEIYDDRLIEKSSKGEINSEIDYYRGESLPYMAPEVIKNLEIIDKSDVWSMGCILIELLTGATPWVNLAENFEDVFRIISNGVIPPLPKNLSKECQGFL
jgi:mitogen-activated protein kinase kinase kinase